MVTKTKKEEGYFYLIMNRDYIICDLECCSSSDQTIDIKFDDLARSEKLLQKLKLESMYANKLNASEWFAAYFSSFGSKDNTEKYEKLKTNPMIRILIENKNLLLEIKQLNIF